MNRKTFVIDTNVLLHDPEAILKFPGCDLVIPLAVVEELESMKKSRDEIGKSARTAIRLLDGLRGTNGDLHNGVKVDNGAIIRVVTFSSHERIKGFDFVPSSLSHRILMMAYSLQDKGNSVVFVSKDFAMRIKAEACGLEAEDYENLKFSYDKLWKGLRKIDVEKVFIDNFLKDGSIKLELEGESIHNEYVMLNGTHNSTAIGRYDLQSGMLSAMLRYKDPIWGLSPVNIEQRCALDLLLRDDIKLVTLVGQAGTGKTLMALCCALRKVFDEGTYSKILGSRPIMPLGKDIGFLPGLKEEKLFHWMQPIHDNLEFLCGAGKNPDSETLRWVLDSKKIEMEAVTYIRGRSLPKMFMIIDEAQNLTPHEVKTIISRAGKGTKVVLAGDPSQIDNPYLDQDSNGLTFAIGKFKNQRIFGHMCLERTERSELAALAAEIM